MIRSIPDWSVGHWIWYDGPDASLHEIPMYYTVLRSFMSRTEPQETTCSHRDRAFTMILRSTDHVRVRALRTPSVASPDHARA